MFAVYGSLRKHGQNEKSGVGVVNELALFAGGGGGILAGHLLGWRTLCAVERDAYAAGILAQRQNDGLLPPFPIWSDITTFDGSRWRDRIDVVSGGFPCQDISCAGKGAGVEGGGQEADCGVKWRGSLAKYNPATHSLRTAQCSLLEDSTEFCVTLPKWGFLHRGAVYQQPIAALNISANESGLLPTPVASQMGSNTTMRRRGETVKSRYLSWATPTTMDKLPPKSAAALEREATVARPGRSRPANLRDQVSNKNNWPTPIANDALKRGNFDPEKSPGLAAQVKLFPTPQARDWKGSSGRSLKGQECDLPTAVKSFPTPCASDGSRGGVITEGMSGQSLPQVVNMFPTPTASASKGSSENALVRSDGKSRVNDRLDHRIYAEAQGQLNPDWVEWLMYWPVGWTSLQPLDKSSFDEWVNRGDWLQVEPEGVPRVTQGMEFRADRLKAIGNGQFPLSAAIAFDLLSKQDDFF